MTVKVVGHWERTWKAPLEEFESWTHPLREYGLNEFYMCPITGIDRSKCLERPSIDEVFAENDTLTRVFVDDNATTMLPDFAHPTNALYVIGKTSYSPYLTHFREGVDMAVKIPSQDPLGGFWGDQAAVVILYDRYLKER